MNVHALFIYFSMRNLSSFPSFFHPLFFVSTFTLSVYGSYTSTSLVLSFIDRANCAICEVSIVFVRFSFTIK